MTALLWLMQSFHHADKIQQKGKRLERDAEFDSYPETQLSLLLLPRGRAEWGSLDLWFYAMFILCINRRTSVSTALYVIPEV